MTPKYNIGGSVVYKIEDGIETIFGSGIITKIIKRDGYFTYDINVHTRITEEQILGYSGGINSTDLK